MPNGTRRKVQTTRGWEISVEWKDGSYQNKFLHHNLKNDWYGYQGGTQMGKKRENKSTLGTNENHSQIEAVRSLRGSTAMEG